MKIKIKIAIDLTWIRHEVVGGTESYSFNLIDGFLSVNDESFDYYLVITKNNEKLFEKYRNKFKFIVADVDSAKKVKRTIWQNIKLGKMLRKESIKYCIEPIYMKPIFNVRKIKFFTTIHDLQAIHYPEYFSKLRLLWMKYWWKKTIKKSDYIIVTSDYVKRDILKRYNVSESKIILNYDPVTIDTTNVLSEEWVKQKFNIEKDKYYYTVSSLLPHKNLKTPIKSIAILKNKKSKFCYPLVISGVGGKNKKELLELIDLLGVSDKVIITPYLSEIERNTLYKYCRAYFAPSLFEGFGMTPIEAMLFDVPVINTKETCSYEISGGLTYYVEDAVNPDEWANVIDSELVPADRQKFSSLFNKYTKESVARVYNNLIKKEEKKMNDLKFIPIAEPHLGDSELNNLVKAYKSTWISSIGEYINIFENEFSKYCGVKYGVSTSNGTTALHLALAALGIKEGDEVIVPDITFAATINAVLYVGATPVIVDIEKDGWCIDCDEIKKAITSKTKAIIPVHIYGQACDMKQIMDIAEKNNLYVIEDCAEAHGAEFCGRKVGSFGIISCFSFFGNKIITTGEGGMCLTNDEELNNKMRVLRDHGMNKNFKYYHDVVGFNYRMTNLQASIGVAQLEDVENKLLWREKLEQKYRNAFSKITNIHFQKNDLTNRKKVTWLVTAYTDNQELRNKILNSFKNNRIDARPFFVPLSEMKLYENYVFSNKNSREISKIGFNLPTSYNIGDDEINRIVDAVVDALKDEE